MKKGFLAALAVLVLVVTLFGAEPVKPTLLVFGAVWCQPCHKLEYAMTHNVVLVQTLQKYKVVHVDIDLDAKMAREYKVTHVPRLVILDKGGKVVKTHTGFTNSGEIQSFLSK